MIQPRDAEQVKYVHSLAAFLIRAQAQVDGGDKPGSVQFTDAFRSLKQWGENRYPQENGGLVEWAEMLAREDPRNDRLVAFLADQDLRLAKKPEPVAETTPEEKVPNSATNSEPPPVPTTLANVVQRSSDKKSDPRPAPVAPKPPHTPSPVLEGNDEKRATQATRRKSRAKKETS